MNNDSMYNDSPRMNYIYNYDYFVQLFVNIYNDCDKGIGYIFRKIM